MHAGFVVGWMYMALWWLGGVVEQRKVEIRKLTQMLKLGVVAVMATLVNPFGWKIYRLVEELLTRAPRVGLNTDWLPLLSPGMGQETLLLRWAIVGLSFAGVMMVEGRVRRKVMIMGWLVLSLKLARFVLPLWVSLIPMLMVLGEEVMSGMRKKVGKWAEQTTIAVIGIGLIAYVGVMMHQVVCVNQSIDCLAKLGRYPAKAVELIQIEYSGAKIFNHYTWGGYLVWQLPDNKVFIDGRMDNYKVDQGTLLEEYSQIVRVNEGWQEKFDQHKTDLVLLPPGWPLLNNLVANDEWVEKYRDKDSVVLVRKEMVTKE
jgi:hypothetical protein